MLTEHHLGEAFLAIVMTLIFILGDREGFEQGYVTIYSRV